MTNTLYANDIASLLCQMAQVDLALMQVEHQLSKQATSQNGTMWRAVRAVLSDKKRALAEQISKRLPSEHFIPEDLFRVVHL